MYYKIEYVNKGKKQEVILKANSFSDALKKFKNKKIGVFLNIEEIEKQTVFDELKKRFDFSKINTEEFISILDQMYVMLDAGMPIDTVVKNIASNIKNKKLKIIFETLEQDIRAGLALTASLKKFEKDLGGLTIAIIRLGEETGDLARAIKDLSDILYEILDNKRRLKKATRYPTFIIVAMVIAFIVVIMFVIPPFKGIFAQLKTDLPLPTRFLLAIESAFTNYGVLLGLIFFSSLTVLILLYKNSKKIKFVIDRVLLKVPIVGPIIQLAMTGRFIYVLQRLIESGLPILDSVDMALNIVENSYLKEKFMHIRNAIVAGNSIRQGFEESKMFENMVVQMVAAGEESGSLVLMLQKISNYYLQKYRDIVDNIATIIEPFLIAAIAVFVLILALGIFLPMWDLIDAIQ